MVKAAHTREGDDLRPGCGPGLRRAPVGRIPQAGADPLAVVVSNVLGEQPPELPFPENDDVIEQLAPAGCLCSKSIRGPRDRQPFNPVSCCLFSESGRRHYSTFNVVAAQSLCRIQPGAGVSTSPYVDLTEIALSDVARNAA